MTGVVVMSVGSSLVRGIIFVNCDMVGVVGSVKVDGITIVGTSHESGINGPDLTIMSVVSIAVVNRYITEGSIETSFSGKCDAHVVSGKDSLKKTDDIMHEAISCDKVAPYNGLLAIADDAAHSPICATDLVNKLSHS